jgi:hypothetical protein
VRLVPRWAFVAAVMGMGVASRVQIIATLRGIPREVQSRNFCEHFQGQFPRSFRCLRGAQLYFCEVDATIAPSPASRYFLRRMHPKMDYVLLRNGTDALRRFMPFRA